MMKEVELRGCELQGLLPDTQPPGMQIQGKGTYHQQRALLNSKGRRKMAELCSVMHFLKGLHNASLLSCKEGKRTAELYTVMRFSKPLHNMSLLNSKEHKGNIKVQ